MTHCGHITISGQHLNVDIFVGSVMEMKLRMLRPDACRRNLSKLLATALEQFRPTNLVDCDDSSRATALQHRYRAET